MNLVTDKRSETKRVMLCSPVLLLGGTEIQMLTLVRTLIEGEYQVATCCYYEFDEYVVDQFREAGAQVLLLKLDRSNGYFGVKKIWELMRKLVYCFDEYKPDIVHVQYLAPGLIPIVAARLARIPTIFATVHIAGNVVYGSKAKYLLRVAASMSTAFFCVSKGVEKFWFSDSYLFQPEEPDNSRKHFTIYNAIDVSKITEITCKVDRDELRNSLGIKDQLIIGIVGRLTRQKGQTILLDALTEVVNKFQAMMLFIVGDGPDKAELQEKANRLRLDKYIRWFGAFPQEEVFRLYAAMDVLVMPSLYEGFGLTAGEAMAAGLPVVGTRVDGLSEIIEDRVTGYLLPVGDSHELAKALIQILSNPEKRKTMGQKGKDRVQEVFSLQRFNSSMIAAYDELSRH